MTVMTSLGFQSQCTGKHVYFDSVCLLFAVVAAAAPRRERR